MATYLVDVSLSGSDGTNPPPAVTATRNITVGDEVRVRVFSSNGVATWSVHSFSGATTATGSGNSALASGASSYVSGFTVGTSYQIIVKSTTPTGIAYGTVSGTVSAVTLTAPVVSSSQPSLNSTTALANITASVSLSSQGSPTGGTTAYTIFTSSTAYNTTNSFTVTRGTSYYFGARYAKSGSTTVYATNVGPILFPYLAPSTASGSLGTNRSVSFDSGTTFTFANPNVPAGHNFSISLNTINSTTVPLPAAAGTYTFSLYTKRQEASGGNNSTWSSPYASVQITRLAAPINGTTPTSIGFGYASNGNENFRLVTVTAYADAGTPQVSADNSTWKDNGHGFTRTRGTTPSFYARSVGSLGGTTSSSYGPISAPQVPYLSVTYGTAVVNQTITASATTSPVTFSPAMPTYHQWKVEVGGVQVGALNLTAITGSDLPTSGTASYVLYIRRTIASGGDGLWYVAQFNDFTITREGADPANFTFASITGASTSTTTPSAVITLSGYNVATTVTARTAGLEFSINGSTFTSTVGTAVPVGATLQIRATSPTTGPATSSAYTITVGSTVSGNWFISTGSTGTGGGGAGNADYGLQVNNSNSLITFSPSMRASNLITVGSAVDLAGQGTTSNITAEGVTSTNSTDVAIVVEQVGSSTFGSTIDVTRGTGGFTITNTSNQTATFKWLVYRY